ncbi:hypothetical protein JCM11251_007498 [Rhodosporidiobolus azoricus]
MQSAKQSAWTQRRTGVIGVGSGTLSLEQQQILASVPRWKKEWVRPASLKPGQNPNHKVLKWVPDMTQAQSAGSEEEMQAALKEVASGNVPLPSTSSAPTGPPDPSQTISLGDMGPLPGAPASSSTAPGTATASPSLAPTPFYASPAPPPLPYIPAAAMQTAPNPVGLVQHANPAKPVAEQAPLIGGGEQGVKGAVEGVKQVPPGGGVGTGGEVKQEERSLVG